MNILFISPNSPEISVGGVERYIKNLISFCKEKQGRYFFLLPSNGKARCEQEGNITIYYEDFLGLPLLQKSEEKYLANKPLLQ